MASCTGRTIYKKPDDLIDEDQMIALWTDIYIAKGAQNVKNTELERKINYLPFVYKKYKVDSAQFMRSNIYYTSKLEDYNRMFDQVLKNLEELKDKYDYKKKTSKLDSLEREELIQNDIRIE